MDNLTSGLNEIRLMTDDCRLMTDDLQLRVKDRGKVPRTAESLARLPNPDDYRTFDNRATPKILIATFANCHETNHQLHTDDPAGRVPDERANRR